MNPEEQRAFLIENGIDWKRLQDEYIQKMTEANIRIYNAVQRIKVEDTLEAAEEEVEARIALAILARDQPYLVVRRQFPW